MDKNINKFISEHMVYIPEGSEKIRRFKDDKKWISKNYGMSIPSKGHNQSQTTEVVGVESFYMSKCPVTVALYRGVLGLEGEDSTNDLMPKVNISWIDVIYFCNKLSAMYGLDPCYSVEGANQQIAFNEMAKGFRIPTDSEWQYACKGQTEAYQYGDIDTISWHQGNSNNQVHQVGLKAPNPFGLYDMLGNIWEWCWDLYNQETYDSYRIFRGGSYAEDQRICGATTRRKSLPTFAIDDLGFRIVKSV